MAESLRIKAWDHCAAGVASAVETLCKQWEPYSKESRQHSLDGLFARLIVPAFSAYLATLPAHHRGRNLFPNNSFSELVRQHEGFDLVEKVLHTYLRQFIKTNVQDLQFQETLETLRVLARACKAKRPKKPGPKKSESTKTSRAYAEYCEFCGTHTEVAAREKGKTVPGYDANSNARLSGKYCWDHRPKFVDGSRNPRYLLALRHQPAFETELKRLTWQARSMSKPNAETGDPHLDLFYFRVLEHLAVYPSDTSLLRSEARRLIEWNVSDKKKRIVAMRSGQSSLDAIAKKVGLKNRQAVAKALASTQSMYRFDLPTFGEGRAPQLISAAHARFIDLLGQVAANALEDPDTIDLLLNDDGSLWVEGRSTGMREIGTLTTADAERIIRFANHNFLHEPDSGVDVLIVELPFFNARFTGLLPPFSYSPVFAIRKAARLRLGNPTPS